MTGAGEQSPEPQDGDRHIDEETESRTDENAVETNVGPIGGPEERLAGIAEVKHGTGAVEIIEADAGDDDGEPGEGPQDAGDEAAPAGPGRKGDDQQDRGKHGVFGSSGGGQSHQEPG